MPASRDELEAIVAEYHHLREEHRRSRAGGRVRRHADARLRELQLRFERLLDEWAPRDELPRGVARPSPSQRPRTSGAGTGDAARLPRRGG
jgi:hypothetical protein